MVKEEKHDLAELKMERLLCKKRRIFSVMQLSITKSFLGHLKNQFLI
jgi:hypothetical protein